MTATGVKALKNHLSEYLRRAHAGERIVITDRGVPVAVLVPHEDSAEMQLAWEMVKSNEAHWEGGKPKGLRRILTSKGKSASEIVLEDRR